MRYWAFLFLFLLPLAAMAENEDLEQQAGEAFNRARRLFDAEDYLAAARGFEEAYSLLPAASVHYNIARSYELAGVPALAAQHYRAFLDARAGNPQRRRQIQQRLTELSEGLGWVRLQTEPDGAAITVDGNERGRSPILLAMPAGEHEIVATLGDQEARRTIDVTATEAEIMLTLSDSAPDVESPVVSVEASPPDVEQRATEEADEDARGIRVIHHGFFWATLGLTIGSGVALAIVGTRLLDKQEEYENLPNTDPNLEDVRQEGLRLESATTALWITTGVLAVSTIVIAIFTDWAGLRRREEEASRPTFRLAFGRGVSLSVNY